MNIKLTEKEYQHMIIELIAQSIDRFDNLKNNPNDEYVDWIYFIERLKTKGVLSDLRPARNNIKDKAKHVARTIVKQFNNERDKDITTMI
jgi:hypothetical protein